MKVMESRGRVEQVSIFVPADHRVLRPWQSVTLTGGLKDV